MRRVGLSRCFAVPILLNMVRSLSLPIIVLALFRPSIQAQTTVPDGTVISANTTWTAAGGPWIVQGLVTINATRTLTVQAGAAVQFEPGARIVVNGTLSGPAPGASFNSSSGFPDNWYVQVNSGGALNVNTATISNADRVQVNSGGSATLTSCTVTHPYFSNNGTLNLVGGTYSCPRPVNIVTQNAGSLTVNSASLDGGGSSPYGVSSAGGSLALTSASITACGNPLRFGGVTTCTFSGVHSLTGNYLSDVAVVDLAAVGANWTIPALPIPYETTGGITVNTGTTWTFNTGAILRMASNQDLTVDGTLSGSNATFTSTTGSPSNWRLVVNSGGTANLNTCTIEDAEQVLVNSGGTGSFTNCTSDYAYFITSGTFNLSQGTVTLPRAGSIITINAGSSTLNTANLVGAAPGIIGVEVLGGSLALQTMNITGTDLPIRLAAAGTVTSTGTHTITGNTNPVARIDYTTVNSNLTWPTLPLPYHVPNGLTVASGATLTIATNSIVKFSSGTGLTVNGRLSAVASVGQKILFTSFQDDNNGGDSNADGTSTVPIVGDWTGITFNTGGNTASSMTRCEVRYTGTGGQDGGVTVVACAPALSSCEFYQNQYGISLLAGATASITGCTMGSSSVTPIAMTLDAQPTFTSNVFSFSNNTYDAIGLFGGTMTTNGNIVQRSVSGIPNVTYVLLSPMTVPAGVTLTIAAGVVIKATSGNGFNVQGTLNVNGTSTSRVYFTSVADDSVGQPSDTNKDGNTSQPGTWPYFYPGPVVLGDPATAGLTYFEMRYATYGFAPDHSYAIEDQGATLTMNNCTLRDMPNGYVGLDGSNAIMTNCAYINIAGVPIAIRASANPTFTGVTFTNVGLTALGILGGTLNSSGVIAPRNLAGYTNITQVLLGDLTIANGANVEVQAGVVLKMGYSSATNIFVDGGFKLSGTVGNPVVFTSWYDDTRGNPGDTNQDLANTTPTAGNWGGIHYRSAANDPYNTINYAQLRYGGYICGVCGVDHSLDHGVLNFENAGGTVTNATLFSCVYGATFKGTSDPSISSTSIDACSMEPFGQSFEATPTLSSITFGINNARNGIRLLSYIQNFNASLQPGFVSGFGPIAYVTEGIIVGLNAVLTVQPGTIIKPTGSTCSYLTIQGGLMANGTAGNPIFITSIADDAVGGDTNNDGNTTVPVPGSWGSIIFGPTSQAATNQLSHCRLLYGGSACYGNVPFLVAFDNCGGMVTDSQIEFVGSPWVFDVVGSANPSIQNNTINLANAPVRLSAFSNPTFGINTWNNMTYMGLWLRSENLSVSGTLPLREFAGYDPVVYHVDQPLTILNGVTLNVQAGTVFKSSGASAVFHVNGRLNINGVSGNPVVFTELRDDQYGLPPDANLNGSADGPQIQAGTPILFNPISDDASVVEHALIRYRNIGVSSSSARPRIRHSTFNLCNWGIVADGLESPYVPYNTFDDLTQAPTYTSILAIPDSLVGLTITGTTKRMHGIISETLVQNFTLQKKDLGSVVNAPYFFPGGFAVGTNATLTISPGVVCKFGQNTSLSVNRALQAIGSAGPANTIVFTHEADDFYGGDSNGDGNTAPGQWAGIVFENAAVDADCDLVHCALRYASGTNQAAITCNSSSPSIQNCRIQHCYDGVRANLISDPVINGTDLSQITNYGVRNVGQAFTINATGNWWGPAAPPVAVSTPAQVGITTFVNAAGHLASPLQPLMGDISLNGLVQAFDASQALQHAVSPFLTGTALQVGDVNASGAVNAADASLILQYTVGLINSFPAEQNLQGGQGSSNMTEAGQRSSTTILSVGDASGAPGDTIAVVISAFDAADLTSLEFALPYDAATLTFVDLNAQLPGTFAWTYNASQPGLLIVAAASAMPLQQDGALFTLRFAVDAGLTLATTVSLAPLAVLVNDVDLTAQAVPGELLIEPGLSTTVPTIDASGQAPAVYPNPSSDGITLQWSTAITGVAVHIELFDHSGRVVFATQRAASTIGQGAVLHLDRSELGSGLSGVYLLRVSQGAMESRQRVVLQ